uniref:Transcription activation suppressor n=1 Tax=Paramormyrops kingsleyae TaxID=1676925 RepID=A0A3B3SGV3_9TELE|nr:protein TASOR isoform X1 [Paramormyrops kingsleyae]
MEKAEGKSGEAAAGADASAESCDVPRHLLPVAVSSSQDGEQAASEALAPELESTGRRRNTASPAAQQRPADEAPRLHFQIPRKNKERKALFQHIATGSREFEDLVKILSSCYRDTTSAGTFSYTKARLVHSELLEKDFIEKRRELKQDGRTDKELSESYCYLLPDLVKLHSICEKGLTVGHSRISILGNPAMGVYLSKYSDLLQMNPFDPGASGEIIIFKVMKGKVKSIYENISKNVLDPTPKFDCHISKNAAKVTSLRSYRAFELTQQYFYEYSFDEIKSRPRHVCPYAVVSFLYKGKEGTPPPKPTAPIRSISGVSDGPKGKCSYTVWSGQLLNGGKTVHHVCLQSHMCPFLPFKLPEKLEIGTVMNLDQVKRKIPAILFSLDTYCGVREVLKSGMYCSLFEVVDRGKPGSGLSGLLQKLERERMVLVNALMDRGFLFLLSSAQMVSSIDRRADRTRSLQALFVFQEPRGVSKFQSKRPTAQDTLVSGQKEPVMPQLDTFVPALHYALMKVRLNPPPDLAAGVQRQARDYLSGCSGGKVRLYYMTEYQQNLDTVNKLRPVLWRGHNRERCLRAYLYGPSFYLLPVKQAKEMMESGRCPPEYSPVSDWEGSDGQPSDGKQAAVAARSNGAHGPQATSADNDPEKMKELLRLIQMCKRNFEGDGRLAAEGRDAAEEGVWDSRAPKRKLEQEAAESAVKYLRADCLDNGEHSRVMNSMGVRDAYLRKDEAVDAARPAGSRVGPAGDGGREALEYDLLTRLGLPAQHHADLQNPVTAEGELDGQEPVAGSTESPEAFSPCSISEQQPRASEPPGDEHVPWNLIPITDDDDAAGAHLPKPQLGSDHAPPEGTRNGLSEPVAAVAADDHADAEAGDEWTESLSPGRKAAFQRLDSILDQELGEFSTGIHSLLSGERVRYTPDPSTLAHRPSPWMAMVPFSEYVSDYVPPVPVQSYVSALCERMTRVMDSEAAPGRTHTPPCGPGADPTCTVSPTPPPSLFLPAVSAPPPDPTPILASQPSPLATSPPRRRHQGLPQISQEVPTRVQKVPGVPKKPDPDPPKPTRHDDGVIAANRSAAKPEPVPPAVEPASGPAHSSGPNSISSLISQLKPEVFSSLVEIIKDVRKNTVKFYIHSQEESDVCVEIKEYLMRLGNAECNPQRFLESKNNLDKLLIIIQNEDIAAHVHKIPALVSLKKLPSVSFAGVDSLDDVKNHTYNELFISGGFIVSDEFVLNPDFITYEKLQAFLKFLEEQSSPDNIWQWKVHCKSQKKLKELGRLNGDALSLLNLLTTYQKRHLVEFLPYHECDGPSRHAPDLDCLVRLQAHHTQHRHIIFLTERRFEMFPHYSNNGVVIATMDDIMNSFHSLIGFHDGKEDVPIAEHPAESEFDAGKEDAKDECVEEEDMSLDSEEESPPIERPGPQLQEENTELLLPLPQPPPPPSQEFCPPLPEEPVRDISPEHLDMDALNTAICHFQASAQAASSPLDFEVGGASPGAFNVNPHQSFLCPVPLPIPSSNSSGAQTRPASPYGTSQGQDCSLASSTPPPILMPSASQGDVAPAPPSAAAILNPPVPCPPLPNVGAGGAEIPRAVTASLCAPLDQCNVMPGPAALPTVAPPIPAALGQQGPVAPPVAPPSLGMSYFLIGGATGRDDWPPHSWSHVGEAGALGTISGTPTSQEDGSLGPGHSSAAGNGAAGTTNSQAGATLNSVTVPGGVRPGSLGSTASTQGSSAPLPNSTAPRPELATPVREAPKGSGLLPTPPRVGSVNGRGQGLGMGMSMPSNGPRGLLRHGLEPRGPACGWRFPHGRGAPRPPTMDFTQDPYPWREEYYKQGEGYRNHRNDYNCW